jgi:hypothetical protein
MRTAAQFDDKDYPAPTPHELLDALAGVCWALHAVDFDGAPGELKRLALAAHMLSREAVERIGVNS